MVVVPAATSVTSPVSASTVATDGSLLLYVTDNCSGFKSVGSSNSSPSVTLTSNGRNAIQAVRFSLYGTISKLRTCEPLPSSIVASTTSAVAGVSKIQSVSDIPPVKLNIAAEPEALTSTRELMIFMLSSAIPLPLNGMIALTTRFALSSVSVIPPCVPNATPLPLTVICSPRIVVFFLRSNKVLYDSEPCDIVQACAMSI